MPTKPLDRLMFVQGGLCFFCKKPLVKSEASVEHLLASSNGGSNNDENCVACCKAVNALLGSMSLKEKFQVTLNQKGQFVCPNGSGLTKNLHFDHDLPFSRGGTSLSPLNVKLLCMKHNLQKSDKIE